MVTVVENIDPKIKPVPAVIKELEQKYAGKFVVSTLLMRFQRFGWRVLIY